MEKATGLASKAMDHQQTQQQNSGEGLGKATTSSENLEETAQKMNRLWLLMTELYGVKFTNPYGKLPNRSWTALLASIPQSGIDSGLKRLVQPDSRFISFVPTGMEFRDLCNPKPQDFGLPCEDEAFKMVINWSNPGAERHAAIAHAIRLLDFYNWKQLSTDKAKKQFSKVWAKTVDYAMNGGKFDKLRPDGQGLTYYPPTKKQKEEMLSKLKAARKSLRNK